MELDPLLTSNTEKKRISENDPISNHTEREPWNLEEFNQYYEYEKLNKPDVKMRVMSYAREFSFLQFITSLFPVLKWIFKYNFCSDLCKDAIAGATVAIMHIPQGMAYATLAGVDPIVGIYMAFFPVLVYFFMGTSRHISMGTFAVVCIMAGKPIMLLSKDGGSLFDGTFAVVCIMAGKPIMLLSKDGGSLFDGKTTDIVTPIYVATALTFSVGVWQVILGTFKLGSLSVLLSETLVSSFTTGASFLVLTSQVKHVFGIKLPRHSGPLKPIYTIIDIFHMYNDTNFTSLSISLCIIVALTSYNTYLKERLMKILKAPLPVEFIIIVLFTLGSVYGKLHENYSVSIVGYIPVGFPEFNLPAVWLFPYLWLDGLIIAIVSFSVNISMASIFARQANYKIDANQELLASGCGNLFGSFYSCLPFAASLSRSVIQKNVGGITQVASAVSALLLLSVMMYFGQFFEPLPHCVLAGIIIASLKQMFMQIKDLKKAWKNSYADGTLWLVTFLSVILLDIDIGLGVGLCMSILYLLLMGQNTKISHLGQVPFTDIYLDIKRYHKVVPIPKIMILHLDGGLHFANNKKITKSLSNMVETAMEFEELHYLILDLSGVGFIDPATASSLKSFQSEFLREHKIKLLLASCNGDVYESLVKYKFSTETNRNQFFPTIHDAVLFATKESNTSVQFTVVSDG